MQPDLELTIALLSRTPSVLNALLRDLPEPWTHQREGENTWAPVDVVAHLIHGERTDWLPRARIILQFADSRPFDVFDRQGHVQGSEGKSLPQLLDEFAEARAENLHQLRALSLQPEQLSRRGQHPSLGAVTLAQLLATWAAHDLTHLHQISRVMAYQYRNAVGPWKAYLGVLQCAGHSS